MFTTIDNEPTLVPTSLRFGDHEIRQPDFIDPETDMAVWFDGDGVVQIPTDLLHNAAALAGNAGWSALTGRPTTREAGVVVHSHKPDYLVPGVGAVESKAQANQWGLVTSVMDRRIWWLDAEGNLIDA